MRAYLVRVSFMRFRVCSLRVVLSAAILSAGPVAAVGATNWPMAGGGPEGRLASTSFPGPKLKVSWSSATEFVADQFQCVAVSNGRVFAIGKTASSLPSQRLFAFEADTGTLLWQSGDIAPIPGGVAVDGGRMCPAVLGDRVFAGGKGVVQAFDVSTGTLLWNQTSFPTPFLGIGATTPSFDVMRPLIARDGKVYAASQYYTVALRASDGAVVWGEDDRAWMAPRASSTQIMQLWGGGGVVARDNGTGTVGWQLTVPHSNNYWYSNVALHGGTAYVLKASNAAPPATVVQAINPDGTVAWSANQTGYRQPRGLAVADDRVYVAYICMDTYCS
ncbi:MAG: PQQ-binding-like beta-propeller repeat protein, partial [Miltoncostaeaceae bacterium]